MKSKRLSLSFQLFDPIIFVLECFFSMNIHQPVSDVSKSKKEERPVIQHLNDEQKSLIVRYEIPITHNVAPVGRSSG